MGRLWVLAVSKMTSPDGLIDINAIAVIEWQYALREIPGG